MILNVFSSWKWCREAGTSHRVRHAVDLINTVEFDTVRSRFTDSWWPAGDEAPAVSQHARCYTPPDFLLLLQGTGLRLTRFELDDIELPLDGSAAVSALSDAWEYTAVLRLDG